MNGDASIAPCRRSRRNEDRHLLRILNRRHHAKARSFSPPLLVSAGGSLGYIGVAHTSLGSKARTVLGQFFLRTLVAVMDGFSAYSAMEVWGARWSCRVYRNHVGWSMVCREMEEPCAMLHGLQVHRGRGSLFLPPSIVSLLLVVFFPFFIFFFPFVLFFSSLLFRFPFPHFAVNTFAVEISGVFPLPFPCLVLFCQLILSDCLFRPFAQLVRASQPTILLHSSVSFLSNFFFYIFFCILFLFLFLLFFFMMLFVFMYFSSPPFSRSWLFHFYFCSMTFPFSNLGSQRSPHDSRYSTITD